MAIYYRLVGIDTGGRDLSISDFQFLVAGVPVSGVIVTSSVAPSAGTLSNIVDGDINSSATWTIDQLKAPGFSITFNLGSVVTLSDISFSLKDSWFTSATLEEYVDSTYVKFTTFVIDTPPVTNVTTYNRAIVSQAVLRNETFDTNVVSSFGTQYNSGGTLTLTDKSSTGKLGVAAINGANTCSLMMTSYPRMDYGLELEVDMSTLVTNGTATRLGFLFYSNDGAFPIIADWLIAGGTQGVGLFLSTTFAPIYVGSVYTFNSAIPASGVHKFRVEMVPVYSSSSYDIKWYLDDVLITSYNYNYKWGCLFTPSLLLRSLTVDLLNYKETSPVARTIEPAIPINFSWEEPEFYAIPSEPFSVGVFEPAYTNIGNSSIEGSVSIRHSPENEPIRSNVLLIDQSTNKVVASTWSDALTGKYSFKNINPNLLYTIVAYDPEDLYDPIAKDDLVPD